MVRCVKTVVVFLGVIMPVLWGHARELDTGELGALVRQDCGSCHGLELGGGLGPPLRPGDLESRSVEAIAAVIRHGTPGTAMPPWKDLLSDPEIQWISEQLKAGTLLDNSDER